MADQAQKRGLQMGSFDFGHPENCWSSFIEHAILGFPQCSGCISPRIPQMIPHSDGFNHQFSWLNPKVFTRFLTSLFCGRWRCLRFLFFEDGTQLFDEEGNELYGEREWYAEEDGQSWGVTKWGVMLVDAGC